MQPLREQGWTPSSRLAREFLGELVMSAIILLVYLALLYFFLDRRPFHGTVLFDVVGTALVAGLVLLVLVHGGSAYYWLRLLGRTRGMVYKPLSCSSEDFHNARPLLVDLFPKVGTVYENRPTRMVPMFSSLLFMLSKVYRVYSVRGFEVIMTTPRKRVEDWNRLPIYLAVGPVSRMTDYDIQCMRAAAERIQMRSDEAPPFLRLADADGGEPGGT